MHSNIMDLWQHAISFLSAHQIPVSKPLTCVYCVRNERACVRNERACVRNERACARMCLNRTSNATHHLNRHHADYDTSKRFQLPNEMRNGTIQLM